MLTYLTPKTNHFVAVFKTKARILMQVRSHIAALYPSAGRELFSVQESYGTDNYKSGFTGWKKYFLLHTDDDNPLT